MYKIEDLYKGQAFTIRQVVKDGESLLQVFLNSLSDDEKRKCFAIIKFRGDKEQIHNTEKFRKERKDIYALKTKNTRICCFFDGEKRITITHGFKKKSKGGERVQKRELLIAEEIRKTVLEQKEKQKGGAFS